MKNTDIVAKATIAMSADEYYAMSEGRNVVTPENIGGLIEYPARFNAMRTDRDLRPALSDAMTTGRAMADFMAMPTVEFMKHYVIADGPVNPSTGKPYGADTKKYIEWRASQPNPPVSTEQFNMFGKMAESYGAYGFIKSLSGDRVRGTVLAAKVAGVDCACRVDDMCMCDDGENVFAIDITTTSDLYAFQRTAVGMYYRERAVLMRLILKSAGIGEPQVRIAAIEKGKLPRCGIFAVRNQDEVESRVYRAIESYAGNLLSGVFSTGFEAPGLL